MCVSRFGWCVCARWWLNHELDHVGRKSRERVSKATASTQMLRNWNKKIMGYKRELIRIKPLSHRLSSFAIHIHTKRDYSLSTNDYPMKILLRAEKRFLVLLCKCVCVFFWKAIWTVAQMIGRDEHSNQFYRQQQKINNYSKIVQFLLKRWHHAQIDLDREKKL